MVLLLVTLVLTAVRAQTQPMTALIVNSAAPVIVSSGYSFYTTYSVPAAYSSTITLLTYKTSPTRLNHFFDMFVVQTSPFLSETYTFNYNSSAGQIVSFQLRARSNNGNQLIALTCSQISDLIPIDGSATLSCINNYASSFQISVQVSAYPLLLLNSQWSVVSTPAGVVPNTVYKFSFGLTYTAPNNTANAFFSSFNYLNLQFVAAQQNANFITFAGSAFGQVNCPANCAVCDKFGVCSACFGNFTLNTANNTCSCNSTLVSAPYTAAGYNITLNGQTSNIYVDSQVCNASTNAYYSCIASLSNINQPLYLNMYTNASFNSESKVTFGLNYTNPSNLNAISSECLGYVSLTFSTPLDAAQGFSYQLGSPMNLSLTSTTTLNFGDLSMCQRYEYVAFGIFARICGVVTNFAIYQPTLNMTLFQRNNSFVTLHDRNTGSVQASYFVVNYIPFSVFNVTTSSWVTALVCLEQTCVVQPTSANVTNGQVIYVYVSFTDPLFLIQNTTVKPVLMFNGYVRNSLLIAYKQVTFYSYMIALSLDSVEIKNSTNVVVLLGYNQTTPASYNSTAVVSFSVNVPSSLLSFPIDPPFVESSGFVWLLCSLSPIAAGIILGLIGYGVSKCLKYDFSDGVDEYSEKRKVGARRFFEMEVGSPDGKTSMGEIMRKNRQGGTPPQARGILEKLMR